MKLFDNLVELVILDVDGVLLDIAGCLRKVFVATAKECKLATKPLIEFLDEADADPTMLSPDIAIDAQRIWPWMDRDIAVRFAWRFQEQRRKMPFPPFDYSIAVLRALHILSLPVALCTTNDLPTLAHQLASAEIRIEWFAVMSTWESGFCKPDPRVLDPIFEAVPVPRSNAVYIGDRLGDLQAARGGDVRFMPVLSGGLPRQAFLAEGVPEDHILEHLGELLFHINF